MNKYLGISLLLNLFVFGQALAFDAPPIKAEENSPNQVYFRKNLLKKSYKRVRRKQKRQVKKLEKQQRRIQRWIKFLDTKLGQWFVRKLAQKKGKNKKWKKKTQDKSEGTAMATIIVGLMILALLVIYTVFLLIFG